MEIFIGIVLIAAGIFSICGSIFNWEWYFSHWKARHMVDLFGRTGARVIYGLIGLIAMAGGVGYIILL